MIRRTKSLATAAALLLLGAAALLPAASSAASAKPAWKLVASPLPANFAPGAEGVGLSGPMYTVLATNVGAKATSGPVTISAALPSGITVAKTGIESSPPGSLTGNCAETAQTVSCELNGSLEPGRFVLLKLIVDISPSAPEETLITEASISGGGATPEVTSAPTAISSSLIPFDFLPGAAGFSAPINGEDGAPITQAGSHPYQMTVDLGLPSKKLSKSLLNNGHPHDIYTDLPRGLVVDPAASPVLCTEAELTHENAGGGASPDGNCPPASQVGTVAVTTVISGPVASTDPLYNMVPPPGVAASLGLDALGVSIYIHILGGVRSDGDFGLSAAVENVQGFGANPLFNSQVQLWGDPSASAHNGLRGNCANFGGTCPTEPQDTALLTMPSQCSGSPAEFKLRADTWEQPGVFKERGYESADLAGNPVATDGCNQLEFEPSVEAKPTTNLAESPTGLDVNLHQPQDFDLEALSTAALREATVTLPVGMTLNPAAAAGIAGCSASQIGLLSAIGQTPVRLSKEPNSCPDASKLGTVEVTSPAIAQRNAEHKLELDPETGQPIPEPLKGSIYLAKPFENPFDSLLAIYLVIEDPKTGIIAKLGGKITADPNTGQLVTRFQEAPQLPLEDVRTHFFGGARAPLISPPLCGTHTTTTTLVPWSSPEGADAHPSDSFATSAFPGGGNCPTSAGQAPNAPAFSAGTIAPVAGAYSPFVLKLSREDGSQRLSGLDTTLPPGLIGKLAGLKLCSEAQIAAAKAREAPNKGAVEKASPSCPASSEVGTLNVGAGAGPTPLYVQGHVYLAGPYKGAPLSLAVITPAVAGPFDIGAVTIRVALNVDPKSAQIHAVSDPFPTVLEGIPLDVRSAAIELPRPDFTLNPTSCDPMAITGNAATVPGQLAPLRSPFQVGGCSSLGFKPKLELRLKGGTKRGGHPAFQATYKPKAGDANVKSLVVRLPRSAFLDQAHIRTICTRVQFAAKACPKGSQYGYITAWTPLLEEPLKGPVYLRSSDHNLPDLLFDLHGIIDVEVATRIDSVKGGIRASIESAPDAPLSKVVLNMQGQKKGLIVNSRNLCKGANRAQVELEGQNGKVSDSKPELKPDCGGRGGKGRGKRGHK